MVEEDLLVTRRDGVRGAGVALTLATAAASRQQSQPQAEQHAERPGTGKFRSLAAQDDHADEAGQHAEDAPRRQRLVAGGLKRGDLRISGQDRRENC